MSYDDLVFRVHAIQRMFERGINETDVRDVLENGEVIESYPDDAPYPSFLVLGFVGGRPIHVVASDASDQHATVVISVYEPDLRRWDQTYRYRR